MARQRSVRIQYELGKTEKLIAIEMNLDELKEIVHCVEYVTNITELYKQLKNILEENK